MCIGVYKLVTSEHKELALIGLEIASMSLIFMLIGQRLAQDYQGAMSLTVYFILTVFGVYLLQ